MVPVPVVVPVRSLSKGRLIISFGCAVAALALTQQYSSQPQFEPQQPQQRNLMVLEEDLAFQPQIKQLQLQQQQQQLQHQSDAMAASDWQPKGMHYFQRTGHLDLHPFSESFFDPSTQCNREGVETTPTGWESHVPYFVIAGAPKSGTTTLASLIRKHPRIVKPQIKELRYYQQLPIDNANNTSNNTRTETTSGMKGRSSVSVKKAREYMYSSGGYPIEEIKSDPTLLTFDGTPSYLYKSAFIFPQILCVSPWIKVVLILRDPVERAFSSYGYMLQRGQTKLSFDQMVEQEFETLRVSGFLGDKINNGDSDYGSRRVQPASEEEWKAWNKYHVLSEHGLIGKGMYDIQFHYLLQSMRLYKKDARRDLMIIQLDELQRDMDGSFQKMVRFLELEHFDTPQHYRRNEGERKDELVMRDDTRRKLQAFYRPHNERLRRMMIGDAWNEFSSSSIGGNWS